MKLAMIITGLSTGGAESMLLKVLEHLNRSRYHPHVISLTTKGEIGPRIEVLDIPVETLGMVPGRPGPVKFIKLFQRLCSLRPDAVHTWMYHADLLGGLAAKLAGIRAVGWALRHSNLSPQYNKWSTLGTVRMCALLSRWVPQKILCCSKTARDVHVAIGYDDKRMVVVPNGFDLNHFKIDLDARASVRKELGLPMDTPLVGMIGRFHSQKNHFGFLDAATLIHKQRPAIHFLLAGSGVEENNTALVKAIASADVAKVTHLLGQQENVARLMAGLDVLASSSHGEAFPNVVGEAMACGVPCAVTDVGDSAFIVGRTGRVVPPGDMKGLAFQIIGLMDLPETQRQSMGEKARERVQAKFDIVQVVQKYEEFYDSLKQ